jgi:DNA-directed RNA polymerase specialized sigma24 family protein
VILQRPQRLSGGRSTDLQDLLHAAGIRQRIVEQRVDERQRVSSHVVRLQLFAVSPVKAYQSVGELGYEVATRGLVAEEVRGLLEQLEPRERSVIELRFGLGAREPATRTETARRLGLRRDDVRRLEDLALRKLRARPRG